ncbi:smad nuclear-interacting protein 1 isoform X2 [Plodia interpunctella]|uniref:smad nuclear-interacting protein 1 isoform X2 n=1 Tax=Plodia interpunctella TaxID=58824 RepID=UPI00236857FC|nr:smad nuclear-interacting protein 1 isoform X2 [Plodia interpunctella]
MKPKKRIQESSEESEQSVESVPSSSSESDSEESSASERRYKKKRKRGDSSDSESDSDDQKRKKRKHKKKKKKHGKKKRRHSDDDSHSQDEESMSEGEISRKKRKHKHKHNKRTRQSSVSEVEEEHTERRLHSVVKERRASSEEGSQPVRTYYQKEYHHSASGEDYDREREVQRFYRGSSKDRRQYEEQYQYDRDRNERHHKYDQRPQEDYRRKPENYSNRDDRGYGGRYNQYDDKAPKRKVYDEGVRSDYHERRAPTDPERYREKDYPERRDKYREEEYPDRSRDAPRERTSRPDKPSEPHERAASRSPRSSSRWRERRSRSPRREPPRPDQRRDRVERDKPRERRSRFADADDKEYSWGKTEVKKEGQAGDKEKPNFGLSGKLTADANTVNGVVIKYTEPEDAKQPKRRWRFYPFKGDKALPILYIHRQSAFLLGRDKKVVDIALEHPSVSKQHAALQYRATAFQRLDGSQGRRVRPYIIDLDSANGTFVNNKKIEPRRYIELLERDVVKFGFSQREYVLLHENSKDDALDDDQQDAGVATTDQIKREKRVKQEVAEDGE